MKYYLVSFYNQGVLRCTKVVQASTEEEALTNAEFSLVIHYPNVIYDELRAEEIKEE